MASRRFFSKIGLLLLAVGWLSVHFLPCIREASAGPPKSAVPARVRTIAQGPVAVPPLLTVSPREIDFGPIGSGSPETGLFVLKNMGGGSLQWTLSPPEGWNCSPEQGLSGHLDVRAAEIPIRLKYAREVAESAGNSGKGGPMPLALSLDFGAHSMTCRREAEPGVHREIIRINSTGGSRSLFFRYHVIHPEMQPLIHLNPLRLDFGTVGIGERVTRRVELTNHGKDVLKWSVDLQGSPAQESAFWPPPGRYVSFFNEAAKGKGSYAPPATLKAGIDVSGAVWMEEEGYPVGTGRGNSLKIKFSGTGITLYYWKDPDGGDLSVLLDDRFLQTIRCRAEERESAETLLAQDLADGPHTLSFVSTAGRAVLQGVRIAGRQVQKGPAGWITVFPKSGRTLRETDYINVVVNPQHLSPGWYADQILFTSNGGDKLMEISLEVTAENVSRLLDVYRYVRGTDYFLTTNPQAEQSHLQAGAYVREGLAFRLFSPGAPGTTSFYRWYNPRKGDRFYGYDLQGGGKNLQGYIFEGSIGNIATFRLAQSRELYRWYHPSRGVHFFTTDPNGESMQKKGYQFDGIAGYVR
ncbi:MAG: hypothetical protein HPY65_09190 [Syntrophaceae bacterium]|nr:hypothetical protein [Syntrophaceae bacterium]